MGYSEKDGGEMRLRRHINEQEPWDGLQHTDGTLSADQATFKFFITNILRDCQPFLRDLDLKNPRFLYSGRKRDTDWFEQKVRSDRQPKDLSKDIHKDFDDEFLKQFGWRPRSNGLFCTGEEASAYEYGNTFMIFPKGQYKFVWSKRIWDLYIHIKKISKTTTSSREGNVLYQYIYNKVAKEIHDAGDTPDEGFFDEVTKEYNKLIISIVESYKSTNITEAIDSKHEIMINCQTYYAVRYKKWYKIVSEFFKKFGDTWPDSDDLDQWLSNRPKMVF